MQQDINDIIQTIEQNEKELAEFKELINRDDFEKFQNIKETFILDAKAKQNSNRLLRIGIIGQIKRGKSSFINALLFDGADILPKGATPMTAALTKIAYASQPFAKLEFYTKQDWGAIEQKALQAKEDEQNEDFMGEISEEQKACLEIYTKANQSDILTKLGETQTIEGVSKIEDLLNRLEEYVGADGRFTPIVKSLELGVNIDSIKNIEIIDTPGTNDPVVSRGRVTQDFIGQCDVVFFLSLSSQFLDQNDMELLMQNIPTKGVENIYLLGSLFDSAMLDTYHDYDDAGSLIENLKHKYSKRAKDDIQNSIAKTKGNIGNSLLKALPPIFISAMAYNIVAHKDNLSEEETLTLNNLNKMYGDSFSDDDLLYIANIDEVEEKINLVKTKKDEILSNALAQLVKGAINQLSLAKEKILKSTQLDLQMLQNNDVATLEKKQAIIKKSIEKGSVKIENVFTSYIIDIEKNFALLMQSLKSEGKSASKVSVERGSYTKTHHYSEVTNRFTNFFNDDWGRESRTETETIYYDYANVYDAIEQLEEFVTNSEKEIAKTVENIIDIKTFRKEILQSIMNLFDMEDDAFDPSDIIDTLKNAVNRITIPDVDIDTSAHIDTVRKNFSSSEVRDSQIDSLKQEMKRVIDMILSDMKDEIKHQTKKIIQELNSAKDNFLPKLLKDSNEKLEMMKANREKLETTIKDYNKLIALLKNR
jgi:hypothetical protein